MGCVPPPALCKAVNGSTPWIIYYRDDSTLCTLIKEQHVFKNIFYLPALKGNDDDFPLCSSDPQQGVLMGSISPGECGE